jgi:hypothetical protein
MYTVFITKNYSKNKCLKFSRAIRGSNESLQSQGTERRRLVAPRCHFGLGRAPKSHFLFKYHNFDMLRWRFLSYVNPGGKPVVQQEIDRLDEYGKNYLERQIQHLAITNKEHWDEPHAKKLTNEDPLYEIKFKANRCATRALGHFDQASASFIVTVICTHKQNVYKPPGAFRTAHKRIQQIKDGFATAVPLQIFGENVPADEE